MDLPFTQEQFFDVFRAYNAWLGHFFWLLMVAGVAAGLAAGAKSAAARRFALGVLALMWGLNGIGYHWLHFRAINPAAPAFAGLFVFQAALLSLAAARRQPPPGRVERWRFWTGVAVCIYGWGVYLALGSANHGFDATPRFGAAPCPTTIYTFGVLMLMRRPVPWWLFPVPMVWAVIGGSAAILLGVPEDFGLMASAALAGIVLAGTKPWRRSAPRLSA